MSVVCPYCKHKMRLKGVHAGRFTPRCDRCEGRFLLVIASEPGAPPMVSAMRRGGRPNPPEPPPRD